MDAAGRRRCVTAEAEYDSNAGAIAGVDGRGLVRAGGQPGEAAILVRYMGLVAVCRVTLPRPGVTFARPPEANFVDRHVWDKLQQLGIPPSPPADDSTFLRRVYLDAIGTLPTADEARAFLADKAADKRAKLIERLLDRPEYADFWAMKWADMLRVDKDGVTPQGAVAMTRWLRNQLAENRPYDQFARAVVTARGSIAAEGPAALYKVLGTPEVAARSLSQVFLGVRIECAQCHHHPSEKWGQDDYWALAGLFSGVARKPSPGGGESVDLEGRGRPRPEHRQGQEGRHGPNRARETARGRGRGLPARPTTAGRRSPTGWSGRTTRTSPPPSRTGSGRTTSAAGWSSRSTTCGPPTRRRTSRCWPRLAAHVRETRYDLKAFTRTLLNSRAYQLSGRPTAANAGDEQNFSHAATKAMPAEVLLDAIGQVTGSPEKFNGWPAGYRAVQVWDNRMPSYFFRIFGRPVRFSVCECERGTDPSIAQALHLMNSPEIAEKVRDRQGAARKLADSRKTPEAVVEELFLSALSRVPTDAERVRLLEAFKDGPRRAAVEDVLWAVLNCKEFLYNR